MKKQHYEQATVNSFLCVECRSYGTQSDTLPDIFCKYNNPHEQKEKNEAQKVCELFFSCTLWGGMTGLIAEELEAVILDPVITPLKYVELLAAVKKY